MILGLAAAFGLVLGSFNNALIFRLPRERSLHGRSACVSCGATLTALDLIPVVSWAALRGRCRHCGAVIGASYPAVELLTAFLVVAVFATDWSVARQLAWAAFAVVGIALSAIDFGHFRLPNVLVFSALALVTLFLTFDALRTENLQSLVRGGISGLALSLGFLTLRYVSKGGMGLGDVKLALVTGLLLGYQSWWWLAAGTFFGFFLGALVGLIGMVYRGYSRKTAIPFGPFMVTGVLITPVLAPLLAPLVLIS